MPTKLGVAQTLYVPSFLPLPPFVDHCVKNPCAKMARSNMFPYSPLNTASTNNFLHASNGCLFSYGSGNILKKATTFSQPFPIQTNKTPRNCLATCCYYLSATAAAIPDKAQTLIKATWKAVFKIHMELLHSKSYSLYRPHSHTKITDKVHRNLNSKGVNKCRNKELFLYSELLPNAAGLSDLHKKRGAHLWILLPLKD